jgi:hypothetical protein
MGHDTTLTADIDNGTGGASRAKVQLRRLVLDAVGAEQARVFDAYAGSGRMHAAIWREAGGGYVGCDLKAYWPTDRLAFVADNLRVLRAIDLSPFNIFDLDSYGCPWAQVAVICARRRLQPGERLGMVLTDGNAIAMQLNSLSNALAAMTGMRRTVAGSHRRQEQVLDVAIRETARRLRADVVRQWRSAGRKGSKMQYLGVVFRGAAEPAASAAHEVAPEAGTEISGGQEAARTAGACTRLYGGSWPILAGWPGRRMMEKAPFDASSPMPCLTMPYRTIPKPSRASPDPAIPALPRT